MALYIYIYIRDRLDQAKSEQAKQNKKQYARRYNNKSILYLNVSSARGDGSGAHDVPMSMYIILYM